MLRYIHQQTAFLEQIEMENGLELFARVLRRAGNAVLHYDYGRWDVLLLQLLNDSRAKRWPRLLLSDCRSTQTRTVVENEQTTIILVRQSFSLEMMQCTSTTYNHGKALVIRLITELFDKRENQQLTLERKASYFVISSVIRKTYPLFQLSPTTQQIPLRHHFNCIFSSNKCAFCAANLIFHSNQLESGQIIMSFECFPWVKRPSPTNIAK